MSFKSNPNTNAGFHITFSNGWTVSVQWGPLNRCNEGITAEVAVWDKEKNWLKWSDGDDIQGWQNSEQVARLLKKISQIHPAKQANYFENIDVETLKLKTSCFNRESE